MHVCVCLYVKEWEQWNYRNIKIKIFKKNNNQIVVHTCKTNKWRWKKKCFKLFTLLYSPWNEEKKHKHTHTYKRHAWRRRREEEEKTSTEEKKTIHVHKSHKNIKYLHWHSHTGHKHYHNLPPNWREQNNWSFDIHSVCLLGIAQIVCFCFLSYPNGRAHSYTQPKWSTTSWWEWMLMMTTMMMKMKKRSNESNYYYILCQQSLTNAGFSLGGISANNSLSHDRSVVMYVLQCDYDGVCANRSNGYFFFLFECSSISTTYERKREIKILTFRLHLTQFRHKHI